MVKSTLFTDNMIIKLAGNLLLLLLSLLTCYKNSHSASNTVGPIMNRTDANLTKGPELKTFVVSDARLRAATCVSVFCC